MTHAYMKHHNRKRKTSFVLAKNTHLWRLYIFILINDRYVIERLPEGDVLVLIVELLLVVVGRAEPFPRQCVYE